MRQIIDLAGKVFGDLTVLHMVRLKHERSPFWQVRCECGREYPISGVHLRGGMTRNCMACSRRVSALPKEVRENNFSELSRWRQLKTRQIKHAGSICERWLTFTNFLEDMGKCPEGGRLKRLSKERPYEPGNVIWQQK